MIEKNSNVPCNKTRLFGTDKYNQRVVTVEVYEGEREFVKDNTFLKKFSLKLPPNTPKNYNIQVNFNRSDDGLLSVSAIDVVTGSKQGIEVEIDSNQIPEHEIESMIQEADHHRVED